jgi:hypothetical protein
MIEPLDILDLELAVGAPASRAVRGIPPVAVDTAQLTAGVSVLSP